MSTATSPLAQPFPALPAIDGVTLRVPGEGEPAPRAPPCIVGCLFHGFPGIGETAERGRPAARRSPGGESDPADCHRGLDRIEPGTLPRGQYMVEVAITRAGERVLEGDARPLLVD